MELTEIDIVNEEGELALGKERGKYFSLSLPEYYERGSACFSDCAKAISGCIDLCCHERFNSVLVAALGNPDITPDALGNLSAANILVTRHLSQDEFPQFSSLSLCRPGVLGSSGIESASQIECLCNLVKPELVIVIDALAGSDADMLCRCIQISDAGLSPGSGVGNNRPSISKRTIGVPVVSIGIPTVIDASFFGGESFNGMFVTPREIDIRIRAGAKLIAYGINLFVHKGITIEDIDALIA